MTPSIHHRASNVHITLLLRNYYSIARRSGKSFVHYAIAVRFLSEQASKRLRSLGFCGHALAAWSLESGIHGVKAELGMMGEHIIHNSSHKIDGTGQVVVGKEDKCSDIASDISVDSNHVIVSVFLFVFPFSQQTNFGITFRYRGQQSSTRFCSAGRLCSPQVLIPFYAFRLSRECAYASQPSHYLRSARHTVKSLSALNYDAYMPSIRSLATQAIHVEVFYTAIVLR